MALIPRGNALTVSGERNGQGEAASGVGEITPPGAP
jgi:hypothetical protein